MTSVAPYRDITPESSGEYETCARHTSRHTSRLLQSAYFCDECAKRLVSGAFNNRPPVFHGETIMGVCALCNETREVTMRQWFACGPCWSVILAYQKSIAASKAIHDWWASHVHPRYSHFALEETEPVYLSPYARADKTKIQKASSLEILDFLVSDTRTNPATKVFHIEQKTGPGSIEEMREFQLDVNDFNDVIGAMNKTGIPSYIVHVQANQAYSFPTRKAFIKDMWWTDIFTLQENQKKIAFRRDEYKRAIFYRPTAFQPIDSFLSELERGGYVALKNKMPAGGIPLITS